MQFFYCASRRCNSRHGSRTGTPWTGFRPRRGRHDRRGRAGHAQRANRQRARRLAADIGIQRIFIVGNRIRDRHEIELIEQSLKGQTFLGMLPYCAELARADLEGRAVDVEDRNFLEAVNRHIGETLGKLLSTQCTAVG